MSREKKGVNMARITEIIFGTKNEAKVKQVQGALAPISVSVRGLDEHTNIPVVVEDGNTVQENARKKALAYAKALGEAVISMDNALYLDGLKDEEQPGMNVRRIPSSKSERPTDEELLRYYQKLVRNRFPEGKTMSTWHYGVCVATPDGRFREMTVISPPRVFTSTRSTTVIPGYPLESLQTNPATGKYVSEMTREEQDAHWKASIGGPLQTFIRNIDI